LRGDLSDMSAPFPYCDRTPIPTADEGEAEVLTDPDAGSEALSVQHHGEHVASGGLGVHLIAMAGCSRPVACQQGQCLSVGNIWSVGREVGNPAEGRIRSGVVDQETFQPQDLDGPSWPRPQVEVWGARVDEIRYQRDLP
jgi:hypothetical protein